jgi:16S rRNA (cytosine967-C5)-methyltransferase
LKTAARIIQVRKIIDGYDNSTPMHLYLSSVYRSNKQFGGRDRKEISELVFSFYRTGCMFSENMFEEKLAAGMFLCNTEYKPLVKWATEEVLSFNEVDIKLTVPGKIKLLENKYGNSINSSFFQLENELSEKINKTEFLNSFFRQPDVFIRIRNGFENKLLQELHEKKINYYSIKNNVLSFPNKTPLTNLDSYQKGYFEIQDLSSISSGNSFNPNEDENWWDCCSGSGGKSLMLLDKCKKINLFVSDSRSSILNNLELRFRKAGIENYRKAVYDFTKQGQLPFHPILFDGIIADVPCSGSGTWARTPERMTQCNLLELNNFQHLQKNILTKSFSALKPTGKLFYITCSVFKKENEDVISAAGLSKNTTEMKYYEGSEYKSDTLFCAVLIK